MTYNEIDREGLEDEIGRKLSEEEWEEFLYQCDKFVDNAEPTQEEMDDFIVALAQEYEIGA